VIMVDSIAEDAEEDRPQTSNQVVEAAPIKEREEKEPEKTNGEAASAPEKAEVAEARSPTIEVDDTEKQPEEAAVE